MNLIRHVALLQAATVAILWAQEPPARPPEAPPPAAGAAVADAVAPAEAGTQAAPGGPGVEGGWRREGGQPPMPGAFMERLRQEHPEQHERLSNLYKEDRSRFFKEVRALMRERGIQVPEGPGGLGRGHRESPAEQKCLELGRLYQEAKDEGEKQRLKGELAAAVQAAFEARLRASKERIVRLEEQLQDIRQHLDRLESHRDRICAERIDELTKPAELRWDGNW